MEENMQDYESNEQLNLPPEISEEYGQQPAYAEYGQYKRVGFGEAFKICFKKKFADFKSRARRSEFWWCQLWMFIFSLVAFALFVGVLFITIGTKKMEIFYIGTGILSLALLVLLIPGIAVTFRRLHDIGKSGWLYGLLLLASILMAIALLVPEYIYKHGTLEELVYNLLLPVYIVVASAYSIFLLVLYCKDSKPEANKWGESPKYFIQTNQQGTSVS